MGPKRVLVTGAAGLLGTWLRRTVPASVEVTGLVHRRELDDVATVTADLRDAHSSHDALGQATPEVVIHAAYALDEPSILDATRNIAAAAAAIGSALVFVSTDAVFAGDPVPRDETDLPDPIADYGRWKADAETFVADTVPGAAVVRLPLLVSLDPADHVVTKISRGAATSQGSTWFDDELRQPAMAGEVAAAIWRLVALPAPERVGVWHLPGPELLSRAQIAGRVTQSLGLDPEVIAAEPTPPGTTRPRVLHLRGDRAERALGWSPSPILA